MESQLALFLRSGLSLEVLSDGEKSKTIFFSRPARGVELTWEECARLSEMLSARKKGPRPMVILRKLLKEGFFEVPKDLGSIRDELISQGKPIQSSALNVLLGEMVRHEDIIRAGNRRSYTYVSTLRKEEPRHPLSQQASVAPVH
jgi:hypothetical protein